MTKETWDRLHHPTEYVGKHAPKWYNVWRVLGPAGPQQEFLAYGLEEVKKAVKGCWDYEVTTTDGQLIDERLLR